MFRKMFTLVQIDFKVKHKRKAQILSETVYFARTSVRFCIECFEKVSSKYVPKLAHSL